MWCDGGGRKKKKRKKGGFLKKKKRSEQRLLESATGEEWGEVVEGDEGMKKVNINMYTNDKYIC